MVPHAIISSEGELSENIKGKRAAIFCGLGKPSSFIKTVEKMGVNVVEALTLPDHRSPTKEQLMSLARLAEEKGCDFILCSEKDWVKLPKSFKTSLPVAYLQASLQVLVGQNHYQKLLDDVAALAKKEGS